MQHYKNRYYSKHAIKTIPYTYLLKFKETGQVYYGVRNCVGADPNKFFIDYFTSSKIIHNLLLQHGTSAFEFEMRKTFNNRLDSIKWELKVLRRIGAIPRTDFFNLNLHSGITDNKDTVPMYNIETRKCIRVKRNSITPTGWIQGRPKEYIERAVASNTRNTYITNGVINKRIENIDYIEDGYYLGTTLTKSHIIAIQKFNSNLHDTCVCITNGKVMKYIPKDLDIPTGFWKGRTISYNTRTKMKDGIRKFYDNKIMVHNSYKNFFVDINSIPEGYFIGSYKAGTKFLKDDIIHIFNSDKPLDELCIIYNASRSLLSDIKKRKSFKAITANL